MKERPILFSGPMVRAILAGRKTQTRRVMKPQPFVREDAPPFPNLKQMPDGRFSVPESFEVDRLVHCPFGRPMDRLWVRETFQPVWATEEADNDYKTGRGWCVIYPATDDVIEFYDETKEKFSSACRPSIFMPRWASRITLEIVGVRAERLQDISEEDARAEGVALYDGVNFKDYLAPYGKLDCFASARESFDSLWASINGAGSWDANPWVWVVEFKRIDRGSTESHPTGKEAKT